jgi:hypothetical protein
MFDRRRKISDLRSQIPDLRYEIIYFELNLRSEIWDLSSVLYKFPTNQVQSTKYKVQELNPISTKLNV